MSDLISRAVAIEEIKKTINANQSIHYEMRYWEDGMGCALNIIEDIPSAEPERKKGRWIIRYAPHNSYYANMMSCSICGHEEVEDDYNFCPNCGADMRGGEDETD